MKQMRINENRNNNSSKNKRLLITMCLCVKHVVFSDQEIQTGTPTWVTETTGSHNLWLYTVHCYGCVTHFFGLLFFFSVLFHPEIVSVFQYDESATKLLLSFFSLVFLRFVAPCLHQLRDYRFLPRSVNVSYFFGLPIFMPSVSAINKSAVVDFHRNYWWKKHKAMKERISKRYAIALHNEIVLDGVRECNYPGWCDHAHSNPTFPPFFFGFGFFLPWNSWLSRILLLQQLFSKEFIFFSLYNCSWCLILCVFKNANCIAEKNLEHNFTIHEIGLERLCQLKGVHSM